LNLDTIRMRLELIYAAISRGRAAFIAATIASLASIVTAWNAYFSSYRSFPLNFGAFPTPETATTFSEKELLKQWVESLWITISPLGIKIGISDAAVLSSISLYIIVVWLFFAVRRQNRAVGNLLYDMRNVSQPELHDLVFHAIATSMLFISVSDNDRPFAQVADVRDANARRSVLLRKTITVLFYLPAISVVLLFIVDVLSLTTIQAAFRPGHDPLLVRVLNRSVDLTATDILKLIGMTVVELILALLTVSVTRRVIEFEEATTRLIKDYADRFSKAKTSQSE
jgi:hypothetical protein